MRTLAVLSGGPLLLGPQRHARPAAVPTDEWFDLDAKVDDLRRRVDNDFNRVRQGQHHRVPRPGRPGAK